MVPQDFRTSAGQQSHRRWTFLQSRGDSRRAPLVAADRRRASASLAQDFVREPEAKFPVANYRRPRRRAVRDVHAATLGLYLRDEAVARHQLFLFADDDSPL